MCVQLISNNLFPCNTKPSSVANTSALVVTIAAGVLVGLAFYLQWGTPVICTLASVGVVASVATFAIIRCKAFLQTPYEELIGSSEAIPDAQVTIPPHNYDSRRERMRRAALANSSNIILSSDHTLSLFNLILNLENGDKKMQFLRAVLEKIDKGIEISKSSIPKLLEIQDTSMIALLILKMSDRAIEEVLKEALHPDKENKPIWLKAIFSPHIGRKLIQIEIGTLREMIRNSRLSAEEQSEFLKQCRRYAMKRAAFASIPTNPPLIVDST